MKVVIVMDIPKVSLERMDGHVGMLEDWVFDFIDTGEYGHTITIVSDTTGKQISLLAETQERET